MVETVVDKKNYRKKGNWFMHRLCAPDRLVYDTGTSTLHNIPVLTPPAAEQMLETYHHHFSKASNFLSGARTFFDQHEYELSAFMLHQCMESAIKAILVSIMQHPLKTHSIQKLMSIVQHVTPALSAAFPRDTEAEITLFKLLDAAYAHSLLPSKFTISREACETLMTRIKGWLKCYPKLLI